MTFSTDAFRSRTSGVLMHITSLPGGVGCGDLGSSAIEFIELLESAGQTWWQMLPVGPAGKGFSPYSARSSFAGGSHLICLESMVKARLLDSDEIATARSRQRDRVDLVALRHKDRLLSIAAQRFFARRRKREQSAFETYCESNSWWLDDWALFDALARAHRSNDWTKWDEPIRLRKANALRLAQRELTQQIDEAKFVQFQFDLQWRALQTTAHRAGVQLLGDVPFYPAMHSADVWANRQLFDLDKHGQPRALAGAPPDAFNPNGQNWETPMYRWPAHTQDGYAWWTARLRRATELFDAVRLDHFIGFHRSWRVSVRARSAKHGSWTTGPGAKLLDAMSRKLTNAAIIAEDLGLITSEVHELRQRYNLPGMGVLQFAFDGQAGNPHLPHNHAPHSVAYTGTHDNDTTQGWVDSLGRSAPGRAARKRACEYLDVNQSQLAGAMVRAVQASVARTAILPVQDVLGMGSKSRMNRPGTTTGNWRWRLTGKEKLPTAMDRLGALSELFGRSKAL